MHIRYRITCQQNPDIITRIKIHRFLTGKGLGDSKREVEQNFLTKNVYEIESQLNLTDEHIAEFQKRNTLTRVQIENLGKFSSLEELEQKPPVSVQSNSKGSYIVEYDLESQIYQVEINLYSTVYLKGRFTKSQWNEILGPAIAKYLDTL